MTGALRTLLSLCAADALGAATEFGTPEAIAARYPDLTTYQPGSVFGFAPGEATDDSQMVVATLLGYARGGGLAGVLDALLDWLRAGPPDVGGLTRAALEAGTLDGGVRAWQVGDFRSAGNGGLVRVAAVWIAGFAGPDLARESAAVTALTHADPRCVHASVFLTALLEALGGGQPYDDAARQAVAVMDDFGALAALLDAGVFGVDTRGAHRAFRERDRAARAEVRARVRAGLGGQLTRIPVEQLWSNCETRPKGEGKRMTVRSGDTGAKRRGRNGLTGIHVTAQSGYVLDTLEAALAHARADTWPGAVEAAVRLGDDSDTVACVVGAIVGARGLEVPPELLPPLRLGHTWPGWERDWACMDHFPRVLAALDRP